MYIRVNYYMNKTRNIKNAKLRRRKESTMMSQHTAHAKRNKIRL